MEHPETPIPRPETAALPDRPPRPKSLTAQVSELLTGSRSKSARMQQLLQICRRHFSATLGRIAWKDANEPRIAVAHDSNLGRTVAARFETDYLGPLALEVESASVREPKLKRYERGDQKMTLVCAPIINPQDETVEGSVTLMLTGSQHRANALLPALDSFAAIASTIVMHGDGDSQKSSTELEDSHGDRDGKSSQSDHAEAQRAAFGRAAQFSSTREFGFSLVNSLRSQLQAEQVLFGVHRHQRIEVEAVSDLPDFKSNSPGIDLARQAMEECLDRQSFCLTQRGLPDEVERAPIHEQWSVGTRNSVVCSLPLGDRDDVAGVVSIRRTANHPFQPEEVENLAASLAVYGAATRTIERASRTAAASVKSAMTESLSQTFQKGTWGRRGLALAIVVVVGWFCFGSVTYRPICRTSVTAAELRHFAAPFDGKLTAVHVQPGQMVPAGTLLVQFDTTELEMERAGIVREIHTTQVDLRQAVSDGEMARAALARARVDVLQVRASALQQQIAEASIKAPEDGMVVLSDLNRRIGQTFAHGDELFQFAADGGWLLEIELPDDISGYVAADQSGTFSASSFPTDRQSFTIDHIDGSAKVIEDRNVFIATAPLKGCPAWLRNGMEGTAQLNTVERPVWWVAMHRVIDWARINFWI